MENKFERACDAYRTQVLDAIRALIVPHPFSAVTLACCAVDLLSHTIHEPTEANRQTAFMKTVKTKLAGYSGEGVPEAIYELRCGLVHEYRTKGETIHVGITGEGDGEPTIVEGALVVSVSDFCEAVCRAFERFFETQDKRQQASFTDRAFIHVMEMPRQPLELRPPENLTLPKSRFSYLGTPPASGTGGPFPNLQEGFPWRDE